MYPAELLGSLYSQEDLPDSIEAPIDNFGTRGEWVRDGAKFIAEYTGDDGVFNAEIAVIDGGWTFVGAGGSCGCLIDCTELGSPSDYFADTYTVLYTENESIPPVEVTVIRQSLCVWTSEAFEYNESLRTVSLEYSSNSLYGSENQNKWIIQNNFLLWVKSPYQNSPVGSYSSPSISTISVQ